MEFAQALSELFSQQLLLSGAAGLAAGLCLTAFMVLWYRLRGLQRVRRRQAEQLSRLSQQHHTLQQEHSRLQERLHQTEQQHREHLGRASEHKAQLQREFENLANRIFENRSEQFASSSRHSLETLLQPFREQITGFQQRIDRIHTESIKGQVSLEGELRKVLDVGLQMNEQASNLSAALQGDNKTAGNWGEAQLERSLQLAGLEAGEHYQAQPAFRDEQGKRKLPDFLILLPDGKHMVIDSKVSLADYNRAVAADDDATRAAALTAHSRAVKQHIDDLSGKDYANLPQLISPDFVLMFMPIEPAYIEAMKHNRELFNYGFQKGVILVSHTTLMPVMRTVANLWMVENSNREAREISSRAGDIYNQVCLLAERLYRLGNTLGSAGNHFNDAVKALVGKQGLHGKVERFGQLSNSANRTMPDLGPLHQELEQDRLLMEEESPSAVIQNQAINNTQGSGGTGTPTPSDRAQASERDTS